MRDDSSNERSILTRLSTALFALPAGVRSEAVWHCLGFVPSCEQEEFATIGPLRALFAELWELQAGKPLPIARLRQLLLGSNHVEALHRFSDLDVVRDEEDLTQRLFTLMTTIRRLCDASKTDQRCLFGDECPKEIVPAEGGAVSELSSLVEAGRRYRTIYADPPWPYTNQASRAAAVNHYATLSIEAICEEPVRELAEKDAHLHLWTTNGFLNEAFTVMDAWGFRFKSCLVWVKPDMGVGNYWRVSHEFLLLGLRGRLPFRDRRQRSWVLAPRTVHSRKPGIVRLLVEKVSPGPYLELYGREEIPDSPWTVYGNQVERRLF